MLEDEGEDQTEDRERFGQCQAEEGQGLQNALSLRLASNTVDVSREDETHTDTTADSSEAVTDHVKGAGHLFSFQDATGCGRLFGNFPFGSLWLKISGLVGVRVKRTLNVDGGQKRENVGLKEHD